MNCHFAVANHDFIAYFEHAEWQRAKVSLFPQEP